MRRCATHPRADRLVRAAALCAMILGPAAASASEQGVIAIQKWKAMDTCAIEAQRAFPDFTAEANAGREAALKECLARQNLPPRQTAPSR